MRSKLLKFGLGTVATILIVGLIGYVVFLSNFEIFEKPVKTVISTVCDYEGLRQAEVYRFDGNAVTSASIHVSVHPHCDDLAKQPDEKVIFTVDNGSLADNDVRIDWVTFDTLSIEYKKGLRIFAQLDKVEYPDSTLNIQVKYKVVQ